MHEIARRIMLGRKNFRRIAPLFLFVFVLLALVVIVALPRSISPLAFADEQPAQDQQELVQGFTVASPDGEYLVRIGYSIEMATGFQVIHITAPNGESAIFEVEKSVDGYTVNWRGVNVRERDGTFLVDYEENW
ncbi:hypothetical protein MUP65_00410 [Patescibacteria group bacterium]|nr:hypothetical protein [Patescibacteria group bacterium]